MDTLLASNRHRIGTGALALQPLPCPETDRGEAMDASLHHRISRLCSMSMTASAHVGSSIPSISIVRDRGRLRPLERAHRRQSAGRRRFGALFRQGSKPGRAPFSRRSTSKRRGWWHLVSGRPVRPCAVVQACYCPPRGRRRPGIGTEAGQERGGWPRSRSRLRSSSSMATR